MAVSDAQNETLVLLKDSAAGFLKFDSKRIRHWRGRTPGFDRGVWRDMARQGWFSILVPEPEGGLGLGLAAVAIVAEQIGTACCPEPFVMAGLPGPVLLAQSDNDELKQELLAQVMAGEAVVAFAWQSADGSLPLDACEVMAKQNSRGFTLSGQSRFVLPAQADHYLVLARAEDGLLLACVASDQIQTGLVEEPGPDGMASAWLRLSDVAVPNDRIVLRGSGAAEAVRAILDQTLIAQSAELCGLMNRSLEMTLDYLRTRRQFGAAIGSFQALQHRAVDLFIQGELARHAKDAAVRAAEEGETGQALSLAASSAKARAAHAGLLIGTQAIQLHGAIGFTDEYDLGLYVNRIIRLAASLGNAADHRRRYGALSKRSLGERTSSEGGLL